jgi:VWFA-related protein
MTKILLLLLGLAACCVVLGATPQSPPGQLPRFQGGVDLVVLDASVLDRNRQPIRGLTAEDFILLEGGKRQPIVAFSAIDLPDSVESDAASAPWTRDVAPDVRRNVDDTSHRIVLIVLDDASAIPAWAVPLVKQIGRSVVDKLTPEDLAVVAFTSDRRGGQEFTHDRARLRAAVDKFTGSSTSMIRGTNEPAGAQAMLAPRLVTSTLRGMAEALADLPQRRKAMVVVSTLGLDLTKLVPRLRLNDGDDSGATLSTELYEVRQFLAAAQRFNVNVYGIDPRGLMTPASPSGPFSGTSSYIENPGKDAGDFLSVISYNTGGFPVLDTNDTEPGIRQLFRENGSYYLLGYVPSNPKTNGRLRRIELSVNNRPDVQVRVRSGYYEPESPRKKKEAAPASAMWGSVTGIVAKTDLTLQVTGAAFGVAGQPRAAVALVLGIEQSVPAERAVDSVDVVVTAVDANSGKQTASERVKARVALRAGAEAGGAAGAGKAFYEVLSRLDLKPGRYQVRLGAVSSLSGKSGSVYCDLDVPDFSSSRGALSGVVLSVTPRPAVAPGDRFSALIPVVPTTRREFTRGDQVVAFLRVYHGGRQGAGPASLTAQITDSADRVVFRTTDTVAPTSAGSLRVADYRLALPIERLLPGPHLLTLEATLGGVVLRRDVRFGIGQ